MLIPTLEEVLQHARIENDRVRLARSAYRTVVAQMTMLYLGKSHKDGENSGFHRVDFRYVTTAVGRAGPDAGPWDKQDPTRGAQFPFLQVSVTPARFVEALDHGDAELEIVEYLLRDGAGRTDARHMVMAASPRGSS